MSLKKNLTSARNNFPFVCSVKGNSQSQASVIFKNCKFCPKAMKNFMVVHQIHETGNSSEKTVHNALLTSIKVMNKRSSNKNKCI